MFRELLRAAVVVGRRVGRFFPEDPVADVICFIVVLIVKN
jgi:hypothetical protein